MLEETDEKVFPQVQNQVLKKVDVIQKDPAPNGSFSSRFRKCLLGLVRKDDPVWTSRTS